MDMSKHLEVRGAHHRARALARDVGAPYLPYKYAPAGLRTHKPRSNTFRAPNPHGARFQLPGKTKVSLPNDTPTPPSTRPLKRSFTQQLDDDSPTASHTIYRELEENLLNLKELSTQFRRVGQVKHTQRIPFHKSNYNYPDFHSLCRPLSQRPKKPATQQNQRQPQQPGQQPLQQPDALGFEALPEPQPTQSVHFLARAGMGITNTIVSAGKAIVSYPLKLLWPSQEHPQVQPTLQNVSLNSNGEEVPSGDGIQAPKRRRLAEQQTGSSAQGQNGATKEDYDDDYNNDDGNDTNWAARYRPSNGVTTNNADLSFPNASYDPMDLDEDDGIAGNEAPCAGSESENDATDEENGPVTTHSPITSDSEFSSHDTQSPQIQELMEQNLDPLRLTELVATGQPTALIALPDTYAYRSPELIEQNLNQSCPDKPVTTGSPRTATNNKPDRRFLDMPEEWQNDENAEIQVCHESFDAAYAAEQEATMRRKKSIISYCSNEENEDNVRKASKRVFGVSRSRKMPANIGSRYKNPRDFFDNEEKHSIQGVGALQANPRRLEEDDKARQAAESKEKEEAEARRRQEADAQLAKLGLRTANRPFITPLSSQWDDKVTAATQRGSGSVKTCPPENLDLSARDFSRMVPQTEWLNDNCVQAATQFGAEYINKAAGVTIKKDTPKCVALNSFFWAQLLTNGVQKKERMLKRVWGLTPQNFLDVESIIVPINEHSHWTFVLIRPQRREIAYVDSFQQRNEFRLNKIREFVAAFLGDKFEDADWKEVVFKSPRQSNSYDCGMFVITNSILLALGLDPNTYEQEDLPLQRRRIAAVILNGGFNGDFSLSSL
ncbi:hypothetical protein BKA67DRAFT_655118 [Truncatella angustata]|uniref:Ubiquitin-like protease family profile domain-containing protein n=1 Tax=Truncatella angustata TaxID=152316 RepID=A0A9P9A1A1_9PEZI|nr:uncharacterized protein BKA67DRAFT_655118 [Truncatella angustata]KAH6656810.1 hypothetical protein BKA67DRAFT_655118 [Truncatella angustata]